jgi:SWI/SNF-related matrix-associated actin-dependent regulator 1 of chromatin subfamily A
MPTPFPHQIEGARFLASRNAALLADDPRVGKTGAAIMACDYVLARKILVVTTASGRPNWAESSGSGSGPRRVQVVYAKDESIRDDADVVMLGWGVIGRRRRPRPAHAARVGRAHLDESHYAKATDAKRTIYAA